MHGMLLFIKSSQSMLSSSELTLLLSFWDSTQLPAKLTKHNVNWCVLSWYGSLVSLLAMSLLCGSALSRDRFILFKRQCLGCTVLLYSWSSYSEDASRSIKILPCFLLGCICKGTNSFISIQNLLFQALNFLPSRLFSIFMISWGKK